METTLDTAAELAAMEKMTARAQQRTLLVASPCSLRGTLTFGCEGLKVTCGVYPGAWHRCGPMRHTNMKLTIRYYTDPRLLNTSKAV